MEADAEERAENKRRARARSEEWKEKAIKAFREEKYDEALENYTKVNMKMWVILIHLLKRGAFRHHVSTPFPGVTR